MIQTYSKANNLDFKSLNQKICSYENEYMVTLTDIEVQANLDDSTESKTKTIILEKGSLVKIGIEHSRITDKTTEETITVYNELDIYASNGDKIQKYKLFRYDSDLVESDLLAYEANSKFLEILEENFGTTDAIKDIGNKITEYPKIANKKVKHISVINKVLAWVTGILALISVIFGALHIVKASDMGTLLKDTLLTDYVETEQNFNDSTYIISHDIKYSDVVSGTKYFISAELKLYKDYIFPKTYVGMPAYSGTTFIPDSRTGYITLYFDLSDYPDIKNNISFIQEGPENVINITIGIISYPDGMTIEDIKSSRTYNIVTCVLWFIFAAVNLSLIIIAFVNAELSKEFFCFITDNGEIKRKYDKMRLDLWNNTDKYISEFLYDSVNNWQYRRFVPTILLENKAKDSLKNITNLTLLIDNKRKELEPVETIIEDNIIDSEVIEGEVVELN